VEDGTEVLLFVGGDTVVTVVTVLVGSHDWVS
jgi:hypothetical protein